MRHVGQQVGADVVGDVAEALVVKETRVGACSGDDHVWTEKPSEIGELIVVDGACFWLKRQQTYCYNIELQN